MIALLLAVLLSVLPASAQDDTCLMCHANEASFSGREDAARLVIDREALTQSVHGAMGFACTTCHADLTGDKVFGHAQGTDPAVESVQCATCHPQETTAYKTSLHGYLAERGSERAPTCATCHTPHGIRKVSDPDSTVSRGHVQATCESCHGQEGRLTEDHIRLPDSTREYSTSVHSVLAADGLPRATCSDCHDTHALKGARVPGSRLPPCKEPSTCGQCHTEIELEYETSIHGRALAAGVMDSPTCTDCHGEHGIQAAHAVGSRTSDLNQAEETCGGCHEDPVIIAKYGMQGGILSSYEDSYHGWASKLRHGDVASCVDCHTAHSVHPAEDPRSTVHKDKVVETCGACHPGSDAAFAQSYDHISASIENNPINWWIQTVYFMLIVGVIGGMLAHNLLILSWYFRLRSRKLASEPTVVRMSKSEVIQHVLLSITFSGLVLTGMALRFPEAFWVEWLVALGMDEPIRAWTHRVLAIGMVGTSVWHAVWLMTPRGRKAIFAMLPRFSDIIEVKDNLLLHLGLSTKKPNFGQFDYTHKAEYWALVWGTAVMVFTGFILWFPAAFTNILPWWAVPAAQNVHYYEAWLAFLAILVWHGFFVLFHPERYPMDLTWLDGKMSAEDAHHHHPRWAEKLKNEAEAEAEAKSKQ